MEYHRTRSPQQQSAARRRTPPLPPQGGRGGGRRDGGNPARKAAGPAPAPTAPRAEPASGGGRLSGPRLTGLGAALFCGVVMLVLGCLDRLLFGASPTVYGVLFLPVCALTAVWVRRGDLLAAPVVVPNAFVVGLLPLAGGDEGFKGRLVGLVTALAVQAGWLYGGTLIAGAIGLVRRVRLVRRRRLARLRPPA